jgi:uncharacterized protein YndB with AHSA1/START domain
MAFTIDRVLEIDAPAETVWQVLTEFDRYSEWNPMAPEVACDFRPGGAIDMAVRLGGDKPRQQREWINSIGPGRGFSYSMKPIPAAALASERVQRVEEIDAGRSRYISHFEIRGWLRPIVTALYGAAMQRGFEGSALGLKQQAEAQSQAAEG